MVILDPEPSVRAMHTLIAIRRSAHGLIKASGYRVRGISVSGIAAKGLESSSGIRLC